MGSSYISASSGVTVSAAQEDNERYLKVALKLEVRQ